MKMVYILHFFYEIYTILMYVDALFFLLDDRDLYLEIGSRVGRAGVEPAELLVHGAASVI